MFFFLLKALNNTFIQTNLQKILSKTKIMFMWVRIKGVIVGMLVRKRRKGGGGGMVVLGLFVCGERL